MNELGVSAAQSYRSISVESGVVLVIPSYKPGESLPKTARDVLHGDGDHVIGAVVVVDDYMRMADLMDESYLKGFR